MGKAQFSKTPLDLTNKNIISSKVLFGVSRQNSSGIANVGGVTGSGQGQSINPATTYPFLNLNGGSMVGPIGFTHQQCAIIASTLDISSTLVNTSYVIINTGGPNLQAISAVVPTDAFLILNNSSGADITLKQAVGGGMNIDTATHADLLFADGDTIILIYNHNPGIWHQITSIPIGGGVFANTTLSNLTSPTTVNQSLIPLTNNNLNLGKLTSIWDVLYINDVHFTDTTDPNGKFTDIAYNPSTHDLEYSQTISGITAGQVFIYNTNKILGITGDNTYGDVGYVEFHQIHAYTTASAGTAPPLPSNPFGYIIIKRNGSQYKIPIYGI